MTEWEIGAMYEVPWSPNPHRLGRIEKQYCQLHGDETGRLLLYLRKKKYNEDPNSWGSVSVAGSDNEGIKKLDRDISFEEAFAKAQERHGDTLKKLAKAHYYEGPCSFGGEGCMEKPNE